MTTTPTAPNAADAPAPGNDGPPKLSPFEEHKKVKDGFDVLADIYRYSEAGDSSPASETDYKLFRWFGLYQQKPNTTGYFMQRIKVPGGQISPAQLRVVADLTDQYARGFGDITTRQTIQLHWVRIENIKPMYQRLQQVGLFTQFACGDTPRNVVSCPLAGVLKNEIIDSSAAVVEVNEMYRLTGKEFSNLPRKYKTSIGGCSIHCHQPQINDVGFFGVKRAGSGGGEVGYGLLVGGGLSDTPIYGKPMRVFIRPDQVRDVARAVITLFRDHGYREKRIRARLKFLVDDKGWEWTRDRIEEILGYKLERDESIQNPKAVHSDHMGLGQQKDGNYYLGVPIERGRWTATNMRTLADLADRFGIGEKRIRLTSKQNVILLDIPKANIEALSKALDDAGLPPAAHTLRDLLISCTGSEFCNLAVVETKHRAGRVLSWLEQNVEMETPLMIAFTGCPHACSQYQIADIGMTGVPTADPVLKDEKGKPRKVDGYRIQLGGRLGAEPKFGEIINKKNVIPADRIHLSLKALIDAYHAERAEDDDTFPMWCDRNEPERLQKLVVDAAMAADVVPLPA